MQMKPELPRILAGSGDGSAARNARKSEKKPTRPPQRETAQMASAFLADRGVLETPEEKHPSAA